MILSGKMKNTTLYKLDRLLREYIVTTYLDNGNTDECLNSIDAFGCSVLHVAEKIYNNEDVDTKELEFVDVSYKLYQPEDTVETKSEFIFEGE